MNIRLKTIQKNQEIWAAKNFPQRQPWHALLGIGEEVGELFHAYLKYITKIRNGHEDFQEKARDAVGDMLIFTLDFCSQMGWDAETILGNTWHEVRKRNWKKFPLNGRTK